MSTSKKRVSPTRVPFGPRSAHTHTIVRTDSDDGLARGPRTVKPEDNDVIIAPEAVIVLPFFRENCFRSQWVQKD